MLFLWRKPWGTELQIEGEHSWKGIVLLLIRISFEWIPWGRTRIKQGGLAKHCTRRGHRYFEHHKRWITKGESSEVNTEQEKLILDESLKEDLSNEGSSRVQWIDFVPHYRLIREMVEEDKEEIVDREVEVLDILGDDQATTCKSSIDEDFYRSNLKMGLQEVFTRITGI